METTTGGPDSTGADTGSSTDEGSSSGTSGEPACGVVGVCGRSPDGLTCVVTDGEGGFSRAGVSTLAFTDDNGWADSISNWLTLQFPDVNGDGISDACGRGNGALPCALGNGDGTFAAAASWSNDFSNDNGFGEPQRWGTLAFPDVDGDGNADVCARDGAGITCALSNGVDGFDAATSWGNWYTDDNGWADLDGYWGTVQFADIDGDGDDDVCGRGVGGAICGLSDGATGFGPIAVWSALYADDNGFGFGPSLWGTMQFPDLNGDGAADVCARANMSVNCRISNGTDAFDGPRLAEGYTGTDGWEVGAWWGTIQFPDLNGDGSADLCGRFDGGLQCALSEADDFGPVSVWTDGYGDAAWDDPEHWATIMFIDVDGDGNDDVCGRADDSLRCAASNGLDAFGPLTDTVDTYSDANGWGAGPQYYRTIAKAAITPACTPGPDPTYRLPWGTGALPPR